MIEKHPFEAFVPEQCETLILGSFPGKQSTRVKRENDWFYSANRNQFWKILELIYDLNLDKKENKQNLFKKLKIGITDIIASCERKDDKNSDKNLINKEYNKEIAVILEKHPIKKILFTSKGVYFEFLENYDKPKNIELIILPSPSPIYRRLSLQDKAKEYKKHLREFIITDQVTDFVYFSSLIKKVKEYLPFWQRLEPILIDNNIKFGFIENTRDIWCCDYMPIQKGINDFIQFEYFPDYYLFPEYIAKLTIPSETRIIDKINTKHSKLIVDGGNVVKSEKIAILTEKVIEENSNLEPKTVLSRLEKDLGVEKVFLIPKAPYDYTGHADGMIKFIGENDLLVSDYSNESVSWRNKMDKALEKTGLNIISFPSEIVEEKNKDGDYTAKGVYLNFTQIGNIILFPQFELNSDKTALEETRKLYPECKVIPINSNEIANDGGVLNCITWNIKK